MFLIDISSISVSVSKLVKPSSAQRREAAGKQSATAGKAFSNCIAVIFTHRVLLSCLVITDAFKRHLLLSRDSSQTWLSGSEVRAAEMLIASSWCWSGSKSDALCADAAVSQCCKGKTSCNSERPGFNYSRWFPHLTL